MQSSPSITMYQKNKKLLKNKLPIIKWKKKKPKRMTILESMDKEHQQFYAH